MQEEEYQYRPLDLADIGYVDWGRLARPQDNQYDTDVFARIAAWRYGWTPIDAVPPTWLQGRVEIRVPRPSPWGDRPYAVVEPRDPRWLWSAELAASWPAQHEQFRRLVNYCGAVAPMNVVEGCGCECGPPGGNPFFMCDPIRPDYWGCVYSTMHSGSGFCEGMCHELAHWKGYALGVFIEDWEHLIFANDPPDRRWIDEAPSRTEAYEFNEQARQRWLKRGIGFQPFNNRMRPLGALFQELWCCVHMMAYHLHMLPLLGRTGGFPGEASFDSFLKWAEAHVVRTMRGHRDLVAIAKPTPKIGERFWHGYCSWVDELVKEAEGVYGRTF